MNMLAPARPSPGDLWLPAPARPAVAPEPRTPWIRLFAIPALICGMRFVPGFVGEASYLFLAAYALSGRRQAIVSLLLVSLLNNFTHAFGAPPSLAVVTRHLTILTAAMSVFIFHRGSIARSSYRILLTGSAMLCGGLILHSLFFSQYPLLSALKSTSFSISFLTLLAAAAGLPPEQRRQGEIQVLGLIGGLAALSLPLVFVEKGYMRGVAGFCGLVSHSQSFGVMMGLAAVVFWLNVLSQRKVRLGFLGIALLSTAFIFLSKARVGGITLAGGVAVGLLVPLLSDAWSRWQGQPRVLWRRLAPVLGIAVVASILAGGFVLTSVREYLLKYRAADSGQSVVESFWASRGRLIESMYVGIRRHPLTGIGFGIPSVEGRSGTVVNDPVFGLPIMATIEKGVLPVAIIEEMGYPFGLVIFAWLAWLFTFAARGGAISLGTFSGALAANIAECTFFSPGGLGLYALVLIVLAVTAAPFNVGPTRKSFF